VVVAVSLSGPRVRRQSAVILVKNMKPRGGKGLVHGLFVLVFACFVAGRSPLEIRGDDECPPW
jgi:hypothetical protein